MPTRNNKLNKLRIPLISSIATIGGMFLFSYLTFIPTQTFAAEETRTLADIHYMQEMNKYVCDNTLEINEQYQLIDIRDGKKYWVSKLTDSSCWMTQNLDFNLTNDKILTPKDSNVMYNWIPDKNSETKTGLSVSWTNSNNLIQSWDPGAFLYTKADDENWPTCDSYDSSISDCTNKGILTQIKDNEPQESYNAHYLIGNYYSYKAATANSAGSICPRGWTLPYNQSSVGSFNYLVGANGLNITEANIKEKDVRLSPSFFVPAGFYRNGGSQGIGSRGDMRSKDSLTSEKHWLLTFQQDIVPRTGTHDDYSGASIRCVNNQDVLESEAIQSPAGDNQANVAITVSPVISIDVTKHANDMTVDFTKVATSTIVARVGSNQPYQVLLSTDKSDLTNPDTNQTIPMIPSDQTIVKGTSNWGIKKLSSPTDTAVNDSTIYSPVGINGEKALFYTSDSATSEDLTFPVAIAVDSSLPTGQYSTQVTLTAVAM